MNDWRTESFVNDLRADWAEGSIKSNRSPKHYDPNFDEDAYRKKAAALRKQAELARRIRGREWK